MMTKIFGWPSPLTLKAFFFIFPGRNRLPYVSGHSGRSKTHRQTEEQPMTVTTKKKKNKLSTTSAQHQHNAFRFTCIQLISAPNQKSTHCFHLQLLMPKHFKYTATRGWRSNLFYIKIWGSR